MNAVRIYHRFSRRFSGLPANIQGAIWIAFAGLILVTMSSMVKALGASFDSFQIVFFRCAVGTVALLPLALRYGFGTYATRRPGMHALRTLAGIGAMACFFYALTHMELAEATAIMFSRPLFTTIGAVLVLGELVRWRRATATVVGFIGILVILRPGATAFEPAALVAVLGAMLAGATAIIIKKLSATEPTVVIVFWFTMGGTVLALIPAILVWRTPTGAEWGLLVLMGLLGLAGQAAMTRGFALGEASAVVSFDYLRLIFAGLIGIVLFAEVPDVWSVAGAAIIIISTLYIIRREIKLAAARGKAGGALPEP
ncbi:MAG: DMT family transporter [Proteobacteria bacterium]|nr:DMT family transporter [Pseudomonadota bacterium]